MFRIFKKQKNKEDNIKGLEDLIRKHKEAVKRIANLEKELEKLKHESNFFVQKIEIKRYNPFSNIGGNQSFSLAILDKNNDGVIISSLFGHEGNRIYGKPIKNGQSTYQLSKEEKEVLEKAIEK